MSKHDKSAQWWVSNPNYPAITEQEEEQLEQQFVDLLSKLKPLAMFMTCVAAISLWALWL